MKNLTLLTDLYQLTMAYAYWRNEMADQKAVFNLFYRKAPFGGAYAVFAGLSDALDYMDNFAFDEEDLAYLQSLKGNDGNQLFNQAFIQYLREMKLTVSVSAPDEGTIVFPHEPMLRIEGPIIQCQLLETTLLNMINFQTLIATKASRVCYSAQGDSVLEFGLRRAQGTNGALAASRAAYIGGCSASSNLLAGKAYGIPVKGTHAHSWVMSHNDEQLAFDNYADAMPNNSVLLVDTYDTIEGIKKAIKTAGDLAAKGHKLIGIRLDSGDLAELSIQGRKLLDEAGLTEAKIVASNDLDEYSIQKLKANGAQIDIWGVGTKLATAYEQPALGGVYKISAIRANDKDSWDYKVKLSEDLIKVSNPGIQQIRRFYNEYGLLSEDILYNEDDAELGKLKAIPIEGGDQIEPKGQFIDLLKTVFDADGIRIKIPSAEDIRLFVQKQLAQLPEEYRKLKAEKQYPLCLEQKLFDLKTDIIRELKENN